MRTLSKRQLEAGFDSDAPSFAAHRVGHHRLINSEDCTVGPLGQVARLGPVGYGTVGTWKDESTGLLLYPSGVAEVGRFPTVGVRPVSGMSELAKISHASNITETGVAGAVEVQRLGGRHKNPRELFVSGTLQRSSWTLQAC